jgi:translation elongation factor EF-4
MVEVLKDRRAEDLEITYLDDGTIKVTALVPWQEVVCDMYDQVGDEGKMEFVSLSQSSAHDLYPHFCM